jgi:ABC-type Fe3+-citrate transport system substrate-binding protein
VWNASPIRTTVIYAHWRYLLGTDLESPATGAAKKHYAALTDFPTNAVARSNLTVVFVHLSRETVAHVANVTDWTDLTRYRNLGPCFVKPDVEDGSFRQDVSVEQTLTCPADFRFNSIRTGTVTLDEVGDNPTWREQPAIRSGRAGKWNRDFITRYPGMTAALTDTIAPVNEARKIRSVVERQTRR